MEKWRRCKMFEHPQPLLICRCLCASTPVCALALWRLFIGDDLYLFYWQVFICASLTCYLLTTPARTQMYTHAQTALTWMNSTTIWTYTKKSIFSITKRLMIHPGELVFLHIYNLPFGLKVLPDLFMIWKNLLTPVWVRCLWLRGQRCLQGWFNLQGLCVGVCEHI